MTNNDTRSQTGPIDELSKQLGYSEDEQRLALFGHALEARAPEQTILDLGCGTGILGLIACRHGARRVIGIERNGTVEIARAAAADNGYADRCDYLRGNAESVVLAERVDGAVCDQLGPIGFEAGLTEVMVDARVRHLRPGGWTMPEEVVIWGVPFENPVDYAAISGWETPKAGFVFPAARRSAAGMARVVTARHVKALGLPRAMLLLRFDGAHRGARSKMEWDIHTAGTLHGLQGWFSATLAPGVTMTNAPDAPDRIRRPTGWLPAETPVAVLPGDRVVVDLQVAGRAAAWAIGVWRGAERRSFCSMTTLGRGVLSREDLQRGTS